MVTDLEIEMSNLSKSETSMLRNFNNLQIRFGRDDRLAHHLLTTTVSQQVGVSQQLIPRSVFMDRVLFIDGDERFSQDMGVRLAGRGLKVSLFRTEDEGIRAVREGDARYEFTETELPDGDGFLCSPMHTVPGVIRRW